jgi:hypothetical protein
MGVVGGKIRGKELIDDKENKNRFLMTWTLKQSTIGANTEPNRKKRGLTDSHLQCATTGTSQRKSDLYEVASLDGGYTDLAVAAVHRELNEKDGTAIRCQICHPYSVKPLWTLLAKFVACRTPGG